MKIRSIPVLLMAVVMAYGVTATVPGTAKADSATRMVAASSVRSIPVLLYHGIRQNGSTTGEDTDVTLDGFTAQMRRLSLLGYQTISPEQYTDWVNDTSAQLPPKPFLLTFDDNQASAAAAAPVVRQYQFRPTLYVVTGFADGGYGPFYMPWTDISELAAAGWYIQFHAGTCGHAYLTASSPYGCANGLVPGVSVQTGHRYYPLPDGQSDEAYHARVRNDIETGLSTLSAHLGYAMARLPGTFAVPWDDWGQPGTSNQPWLSQYFAATFPVVFVQESYPGATVALPLHMRYRYQVGVNTTLSDLTDHLGDSRFMAPAPAPGPATDAKP